MTDTVPIASLLAALRRLADGVNSAGTISAGLCAVTSACAAMVSDAEAVGITSITPDGYESIAPTDELAERVDGIQFDVGSGPCLDAAANETAFRVDDLQTDPRWPVFGARAVSETGVRSMLSYRLYLDDEEHPAALNFYSREPAAFDDTAQLVGLAGSAYGAELITSRRRNVELGHLRRAVESNRDIGAAVGVLMARHKVTREQAFDLLRITSQNTHRKLADIARDVVETGTLDIQ